MGLLSTPELLCEVNVHYTHTKPSEDQMVFTRYVYSLLHIPTGAKIIKVIWVIGSRRKALELINYWNMGGNAWKYVLRN